MHTGRGYKVAIEMYSKDIRPSEYRPNEWFTIINWSDTRTFLDFSTFLPEECLFSRAAEKLSHESFVDRRTTLQSRLLHRRLTDTE